MALITNLHLRLHKWDCNCCSSIWSLLMSFFQLSMMLSRNATLEYMSWYESDMLALDALILLTYDDWLIISLSWMHCLLSCISVSMVSGNESDSAFLITTVQQYIFRDFLTRIDSYYICFMPNAKLKYSGI